MANTSTTDVNNSSNDNTTANTNSIITTTSSNKKDVIKPQTRLDLSINPSDGTLLTAPLSLVLNTATDALYNDLHSMVNDVLTLALPSKTKKASKSAIDENLTSTSSNLENGNIESTSPSDHPNNTTVNDDDNNNNVTSTYRTSSTFTTKQESMSNMSFQQRRHILASTLAKHGHSIAHISALVASNLFSSGSTSLQPSTTTSSTTSSSSSSKTNTKSKTSQPPPQINIYSMSQTPPENELSSISIITSQALNHIRTSWVNADEAQDALYFHHDTLWKIRHHPHDVRGALDVIMKGCWIDLSQDICLKSDGYRDSEEGQWSVDETRERLKCSIRRKLVLGEVGVFHNNNNNNRMRKGNLGDSFWWNMVLEQNGTVVRLFYGRPFVVQEGNTSTDTKQQNQKSNQQQTQNSISNTKTIYPIEARLTILSEKHPAPWTLLSIRIRTNVKTGESNHQLDLNQEQMYRFHRLCDIAMNQEENRVRMLSLKNKKDGKDEKEEEDAIKKENDQTNTSTTIPANDNGKTNTNSNNLIARPLEKLLDMSHVFSLSWQLEILSSQADALRKGTWSSSKYGLKSIAISHVHFFKEEDQFDKNDNTNGDDKKVRIRPLAVMAIHFWEVDDRNGRPTIGALTESNDQSSTTIGSTTTKYNSLPSKSYLPPNDKGHTKRLTLEIIAVPRVGLEVSISGGDTIMSQTRNGSQSNSHLQRNVDKLLSSVQDPFQLSASEALLCAAVICAENRCHAALNALLRLGKNIVDPISPSKPSSSSSRGVGATTTTKSYQALPPWLHLTVECGCISISANISYHGEEDTKKRSPVLLFRLACDSRTGCFVPIFPESTTLLRNLTSNDPKASEVQLLRQAKSFAIQNAAISTKSSSKKRGMGSSSTTTTSGTSSRGNEFTGRVVRDAFESLTRSMDILGRRVGVGGEWDDVEEKFSPALREKSIMQSCDDVRSSLMTCSSIVVVYGVAAMAAAVASGVDPLPDVAGGLIDMNNKNDGLQTPSSSSMTTTSITPPLGVVMDQEMREEETISTNGDKSITMKLDRYVCGIVSTVSPDALTLHLYDINTVVESVTELATRTKFEELPLALGHDMENNEEVEQPQTKRIKLESNVVGGLKSFTDEIGYLADRFRTTWNKHY